MKINFKVRLRNPYFYIGLIAVILTATGAEPQMFTSWQLLIEKLKAFVQNPFLIGCTAVAVIGYINDPTTCGLSDSKEALSYYKPKKGSLH